MRYRNLFILAVVVIMLLVFGCSHNNNPISSSNSPNEKPSCDYLPVGITDYFANGNISGGMGTLGLFQLQLDPINLKGELTSLRKSMLTDVLEVVDITNFLQLAPCTDCAKIRSVSLDADGHLVVSIGIKHPFAAGDPFKPITGRNRADLHVFNVEGMVVSNEMGTTFSNLENIIAGFRLLNADGYTGYLDDSLDDIFATEATIHPYLTHFDDYSAGNFDPLNPMGFDSVTIPPPSGNLVMAMGCDYNYQDYVFEFPSDSNLELIYGVGCTYAVSAASKPDRFSPEYRIPQHNKKAASEVSVEITANNLAGGNTASTATLQIRVVDINHGVAVGDALNEMLADSSVSAISVEIPGVTSGATDFSTIPLSGTGHDPSDPLIFEGTITNSSGGSQGDYIGLVKVTDNYAPKQNGSPYLNSKDGIKRVEPDINPLTGLFTISEFATYQVFNISVGMGTIFEVLTPNGGERWIVTSNQEITWVPAGVPGAVFIEYSKDNFVSDIHAIASGEDNDGSYLWQNIPDDPSNTVRVRITSTDNPDIFDISDADFSIVTYVLAFSDEGVLPEMISTWDDISPALCVETDGDIKMAYNCNKVIANDEARSYACKSVDGLNWTDFQTSFFSWGGVLANHGDNTKIVADNTGNSFRYLSLYWVETGAWSTPFAAATELFPPPYDIDGAHITTYISRAPEMIMDADEYVYILGDQNNQIQFKKSEIPGHLTGGPSGVVWQNFPIYYISQGYLSRARSIELAPNNKMYLVYYIDDSANVIKLAYNTDSTGLIWDATTTVYDGSTTTTTGAHDPGLDVTPDGEFHATFIRVSDTNNQLCYVHSDDGTSWSEPVVISEMPVLFNDDPICFFVFDGFNFLATVWKGGDHVYISFSFNDGHTWANAAQVDSLLPENAQPDFTVTSDGVMHVAWAAKNGTHYDIHFRNAWFDQS